MAQIAKEPARTSENPAVPAKPSLGTITVKQLKDQGTGLDPDSRDFLVLKALEFFEAHYRAKTYLAGEDPIILKYRSQTANGSLEPISVPMEYLLIDVREPAKKDPSCSLLNILLKDTNPARLNSVATICLTKKNTGWTVDAIIVHRAFNKENSDPQDLVAQLFFEDNAPNIPSEATYNPCPQ